MTLAPPGRRLAVGDVVGIDWAGVRHEGIVSGVGPVRVIHSSKRRRRVVEEDLGTFSSGRAVHLVRAADPDPSASLAFARACIEGGRRWTPRDNCQAFTRDTVGAALPSRDAARIGWALVGLSALVAFARR